MERTPLHWAGIKGNAEVAKGLLGLGADVHAKDKVKLQLRKHYK